MFRFSILLKPNSEDNKTFTFTNLTQSKTKNFFHLAKNYFKTKTTQTKCDNLNCVAGVRTQ